MSFATFFSSSVFFFTTSVVAGWFFVLVSLPSYERLLSDDLFALLMIIVLGVLDLSVLILCLEEKLLPGCQNSRLRPLSPRFCPFHSVGSLSAKCSSKHSCPEQLNLRTRSQRVRISLYLQQKRVFHISAFSSHFSNFPLRRSKKKHTAYEYGQY